MEIIENLKLKATFLNRLSNNEKTLFGHINSNHDNLDEVIQQYKPEDEFKPVNTLRFLIANELKKRTVINATVINQLKQAIEDRDVSGYFNLNDTVKQSLLNYKDSKKGMFPNWGHTFKVLFPFLYNTAENAEVNSQLNHLADEIIKANQLENVTKHIVNFQGSQNYGSDHVWVAIIPDTAPSVQYAYQIFFTINKNGLVGGLHKGHNLTKQVFANQDLQFNLWEDYIEHVKHSKDEWLRLNSEVNFIFLNDEKAFVKVIKKVDTSALSDYFKTLDSLKEDLDIQDEEKLVFSIAKSQLSFQVGKRYCLNVNKKLFDFISYNELEGNNADREIFTGSDIAYLYKNKTEEDVSNYYEDIRSAIETEIERDNHALAKSYDNSAFRKAVFDGAYRERIFNQIGMQNKYYLVGAYWDTYNPQDQTERFLKEGIWINGYDDKFIELVNKVPINSHIAIKTVDRKGDNMYIKARGVVKSNLNDGQNLIVKWDKDFKEFKVDFSGGYWDTITNVNKADHIKAIWDNNSSMNKNVKKEFINWLVNKPKSKYFKNDKETLNRYLDTYNTYFTIDVFEVSQSNYKTVIEAIDKAAYKDEKSNFFKYSEGESNHRPRAILGKTNYYQFLNEKFNGLDQNSHNTTTYNTPLNQIFYGPPGTGKTYNTILEAAKIITQDETISYDDAQDVFNTYLGDRIEFITFHQNYSYEDFIQGLRPDTEASGELSFFKSDGVFKRIADRALKNLQDSENPEFAKKEFDKVFYDLIKPLNEGNVDEFEIKMKQTSFYITEVGEKSIEFRKNQGDSKHTLSINTLKKMYDSGANDIILGGLQPYYNPILKLLLEKGKRDVEPVKKRNYVIIIDEINRANISRVFGELITLIEKDKRFGGKIPINATLPSGDKFIVPSNLYIIGTMNTADKSIALLDIALRRRFEFVPMYPNSTSTEDKVVHDATVLDAINQEIITRKGYDFTIGHSYFMGEDYNLKNTIDNKVIPLLLEYFMNDFTEVKNILSASKLDLVGWPMKLKLND